MTSAPPSSSPAHAATPVATSVATLSPQDFLTRWQHADGSELANYQLFVTAVGLMYDFFVATLRKSNID